MKIAVVGTGYVGLVTGTCFADMGNDVRCVDVNEKKIEDLNKGIIPIYEPGLEAIILNNFQNQRIRFTTDIKSTVEYCDVLFIAVGTPRYEDGSADLSYVLNVAKELGQYMNHHLYVVNKSTVPVGTAKKVQRCIQNELDKRDSNLTFDVISNPEFLKEGSAVEDCMKPDRIIIGVDNEQAGEFMKELYKPYVMNTENFILMDVASAEMTKYAANAMLATKISFMNDISNICERVGANVNKVRKGIGSDKRIGYHFIYPGCGYGGSCFPKDVQALISTANEHGYDTRLLDAVQKVNDYQKHVITEKVIQRFGKDLNGRSFGVWGLAFKPDTDDMRESSAITIINDLTSLGADIIAYDPKAMAEAKECYLKDNLKVQYVDSKYTAVRNADAMILVTEWKEFRSPDFYEIKNNIKNAIIFDGRNQYDEAQMEKYGFEYYPMGVKKQIKVERNEE